jgi:hypothetical protein
VPLLDGPVRLAFAVGLGVSGAWLLGLYGALGGHFAFPLDDTYIHLQYARELAAGHPLRYDAGDPTTTGATSTLWPLLLAPGFIGGSVAAALAWTAVLASLLVAGTGALLAWAALELGGPRLAVLAGLGGVLNGWFLFTSLSGMESGLIAFGVALALAAVVHGRLRLLALALVLVALARPEGAIAVVLFAAAALAWPGERRRLGRAVAPGIAAAVLQAVMWTVVSGRPATDTAVAKSVVYEPGLSTGLKAAEWLGAFGRAGAQFVRGAVPSVHHPEPGEFLVLPYLPALLAVAGAVVAWRSGHRLLVLVAAAVAVSYLGVAASGDWSAHHFRYLTALLPVLVLLAVPALGLLGRAGTWLAAALVALTALGIPLFHRVASTSAAQLNAQHVWLGRWLADNVEPGTRIAFHDAGALKLYSGLPHFDWLGLVTADEAETYRSGRGAIFERLERLPAEERPDLFVMWPNLTSDLIDAPFTTDVLRVSPDLGPATRLGGPTMAVFAADWSSLRLSRVPPLPYGEAAWDVDVADLVSEPAAGYEWRGASPLRPPLTVLVSGTREDGDFQLAEGCRQVMGESFRVPSAGTLVARFRAPARVDVTLDGEPIGTISATGPEDRFAGGSVQLSRPGVVRLVAEQPYVSCHYWLVP